jgi:hypothetical protein
MNPKKESNDARRADHRRTAGWSDGRWWGLSSLAAPPRRRGVASISPYGFSREAAAELFRLRDRVHALESQALAAKLYGGSSGGWNIPQPWRVAELPPFEALYRTGFSGELKGPVLGSSGDQLIALLEALLAALRPNPNPAEYPSEVPR